MIRDAQDLGVVADMLRSCDNAQQNENPDLPFLVYGYMLSCTPGGKQFNRSQQLILCFVSYELQFLLYHQISLWKVKQMLD